MELKHNSLTDRCSYNKIGLSFNIITNALLYKGSTSDFGSECRGSNPLGATIKNLILSCHNKIKTILFIRFLFRS